MYAVWVRLIFKRIVRLDQFSGENVLEVEAMLTNKDIAFVNPDKPPK